MRGSVLAGGIAAAVGLWMTAGAGTASAACSSAATGTIVGGVGGALIGGAISHNAGGAFLGGLGGAVVGHEIGRSGCRSYRTRYYYRSSRRGYGYGYGYNSRTAAPSGVYYDSYGRPVYPGYAAGYVPASSGYGAGPCRTETQSYYDERGELLQRTASVCGR